VRKFSPLLKVVEIGRPREVNKFDVGGDDVLEDGHGESVGDTESGTFRLVKCDATEVGQVRHGPDGLKNENTTEQPMCHPSYSFATASTKIVAKLFANHRNCGGVLKSPFLRLEVHLLMVVGQEAGRPQAKKGAKAGVHNPDLLHSQQPRDSHHINQDTDNGWHGNPPDEAVEEMKIICDLSTEVAIQVVWH